MSSKSEEKNIWTAFLIGLAILTLLFLSIYLSRKLPPPLSQPPEKIVPVSPSTPVSPPSDSQRLVSIKNGSFYYKENRIKFKGVNLIVKAYPFIPNKNIMADTISALDKNPPRNTHNCIRFGTLLAGMVPTKPVSWPNNDQITFSQNWSELFNECMNDIQAYNKTTNNKVFILLDLHQDAITGLGCGEGWPDWFIELMSSANMIDYVYKNVIKKTNPEYASMNGLCFPFTSDCGGVNGRGVWGGNLLNSPLGKNNLLNGLLKNFYNKDNPFMLFYANVIKKLWEIAKQYDFVIGIDVFNEPLVPLSLFDKGKRLTDKDYWEGKDKIPNYRLTLIEALNDLYDIIINTVNTEGSDCIFGFSDAYGYPMGTLTFNKAIKKNSDKVANKWFYSVHFWQSEQQIKAEILILPALILLGGYKHAMPIFSTESSAPLDSIVLSGGSLTWSDGGYSSYSAYAYNQLNSYQGLTCKKDIETVMVNNQKGVIAIT